MNIQLRRMNVVKQVDSEDKAKRLEALGFKRIADADAPEPPAKVADGNGQAGKKASGGKKATPTKGQKGDGKAAQKEEVKADGGGENAAEPGGADNSGGDRQPENG